MPWILIHLLILAAISLAFLPAFLVGCIERRAVRMFELSPILYRTRYMDNAVASALAAGFFFRCDGRHIKRPNVIFGTLLLSPDRLVLAVCSSHVTILLSRFNDESFLITLDNMGVAELDQLTELQLTPRFGFDRMLKHHTQRVERHIGPAQFPIDADWDAVTEIYRAKSDRIIERGVARYADAAHDLVCYTPLGSFRATVLHGWAILHRPVFLIRQFLAVAVGSRKPSTNQAASTRA